MSKDYFITPETMPSSVSLDYTTLRITDFGQEYPADARMFLVNGNSPEFAKEVCLSIRLKDDPSVYLKPVVLVSAKQNEKPCGHNIFDGFLETADKTGASFQKLADFADTAYSKIEQLSSFSSTDTNIAMKVIRFLFVRSGSISPERTTLSAAGYSFPGIDSFLEGDNASIIHILNFLEEQRVLSGTFFEKSYFCNHCNSAFLNFQEVCPHCRSADLEVEDLIHHFACAYVGPAGEFGKSGRKSCPKCEKELRHVGVDFDKPSIIYTCNPCGHSSQDPEISTTCFSCGRKSPPENLLQLTLKRYTLTGLGKSAALHGMDSLFRSVMEKNMPTIPLDSFKTFLGVEIQRIKRYKKTTSTIIMVRFPDLDRIYIEFGVKAVDIFYELSVALKSVFRESDMITSLTDNLFLSILVETSPEGADNALARVHRHAERLFTENIGRPLQFASRSLLITADHTVDRLIDGVTECGDF